MESLRCSPLSNNALREPEGQRSESSCWALVSLSEKFLASGPSSLRGIMQGLLCWLLHGDSKSVQVLWYRSSHASSSLNSEPCRTCSHAPDFFLLLLPTARLVARASGTTVFLELRRSATMVSQSMGRLPCGSIMHLHPFSCSCGCLRVAMHKDLVPTMISGIPLTSRPRTGCEIRMLMWSFGLPVLQWPVDSKFFNYTQSKHLCSLLVSQIWALPTRTRCNGWV